MITSPERQSAGHPTRLLSPHVWRAAITLAAVALLLSACGGSGPTAGAAKSQNSANPQSSGQPAQANRQRQLPGASGEVVAIAATTLQVQNSTSQTAVTYTKTTSFTDTAPATAAMLKVGLCVSARPAPSSSASSSATSAPGNRPTSVVAARITLSQPVNGECAAGFGSGGGGTGGGGFGGFARGTGGAQPSGTPGGNNGARPSGAARGGFGGFGGGFGATGKISSISGTTFVVASVRRPVPNGQTTPSAAPNSSDITVTTTSTTIYRQTLKSTASAVKVGRCVTALGKADDTGAITATAISVSPKENGSCAGGGPGA
ncbi:MAG: hypothetical protein QOK10_3238 [Pseudonocardiales bacterium]|nr:hypothetical protein [Pseudonocardiales bacterium]